MFDVMADINGELTYITTLDSRWMDSRITVEFPWQAHRAFGTRIAVDLVLQPNHEKALRSVHHPRLWNTPVRLEKVPVYWERW